MKSYVLRYCGWFLGAWGLIVGLLLVVVGDSRFTSPQWKFIREIPGEQTTMGLFFMVSAALLLTGLVTWRDRLASIGANLLGGILIIFATFLGAAAMTEVSGGILGLPTFGLIGVFFLIFANLIRRSPWS